MTRISLIAAVAENGVIGKNNDLPWKIKSEFQYFKDTTMGRPIIMGRKSFMSLGKPLPGRANIVITRDKTYQAEGARAVHTLDEALALAKDIAAKDGIDEIFVVGGADIYRMALSAADRLYLTEIHMKPDGDIFFPDFDRAAWKETKREFHKALPGEDADYTITVLEKNSR